MGDGNAQGVVRWIIGTEDVSSELTKQNLSLIAIDKSLSVIDLPDVKFRRVKPRGEDRRIW